MIIEYRKDKDFKTQIHKANEILSSIVINYLSNNYKPNDTITELTYTVSELLSQLNEIVQNQDRYTCDMCPNADTCPFAFDDYCVYGSCLNGK